MITNKEENQFVIITSMSIYSNTIIIGYMNILYTLLGSTSIVAMTTRKHDDISSIGGLEELENLQQYYSVIME